ncbi:MAG: CdiA family toxin C-terminal domain-containing protein, partial [Burkholderiaceae bacterium]|nr:CdiA family toxin C-terminal domain-containing protein [Burkholderiaceae bacterium]
AAGSAIRALGNPDDPAATFASDFLSSFIPAPQPLNPLDPNTAPAEPGADPLGEFIAQNQEAWNQRAADQQVAQTAGGMSGVDGADNSISAPGADGNVSIQDTGAPESADPLGEFIAQNQEAWDQRYENYQQIVDEFTQAGDRPVADGIDVAGPGLGYDPYTFELIDREQQRVQSLKTGAGVLVDKETLRYFDALAREVNDPRAPFGSVMKTFDAGVEQMEGRIMAGGYKSYDKPVPAAEQDKVLQLQALSANDMDAVNSALGRYYEAYDSMRGDMDRLRMASTPEVLSFAQAYGQLNENQRGYVLANIANNAVQSSEYMDYYRASGYLRDTDKPLEGSVAPWELVDPRSVARAVGSVARGAGELAVSGVRLAGAGARGVEARGATSNLGTSDALLPDADFLGRGVVRSDLTDHLVNATTSGKQISGGHDLNNFTTALNDAGGSIVSKIETAPGIYEVKYQLPNAAKLAVKTIYDPAVYPNMLDMANTAASKALYQYQSTGNISQVVVVDGVNFSVPIRIQNGQPYVPTAYPVGVEK